jgi:HAD superfamily hydrolase (TIGR01549 family)
MNRIKVVAFDCDGVLFDSKEANTAYYNQILNRFGYPDMTPEQEVYAHMHAADQVMAYLFPDREILGRANTVRGEVGYLPFIQYMRMEPYLKEMLERLRPVIKTAIATNRTNTMPTILKTHDLGDAFDLVVTAQDVRRPKPDPEMLLNILTHFDIRPDEAVYVGDSLLDEQAARAAGIPLVAYKNQELAAACHVDSFMDLADRLLAGDNFNNPQPGPRPT